MARATVRAAVTSYLDTPAVAGLVKVRSAKPRNWQPADFRFDTATRSSSAAGYVHIETESELRAATGKKFAEYVVALVLCFRSQQTGAAGSEDLMADFDTLIGLIKAKLRTKPPLGVSDGTIFEAAEQLLEVTTDVPQHEPTQSEIWAEVRFDVSEWLTA